MAQILFVLKQDKQNAYSITLLADQCTQLYKTQ